MNQRFHIRKKGFALMAVIWVVMFLSMVLILSLTMIKVESENAIADEHTHRAWQLAHTGLSYASHPNVERDAIVLTYEPEDVDEGFKVDIKSEASKININFVLKNNDKALLRGLFEYWLNDPDKAAALADAMVDWVDKDDLLSLNGAEKEWYNKRGFQGRPFNRSFQSLDEVRLVKGFDEVENRVLNWRDWFTLFSEGGVDVHEATAELLSVVAVTSINDAEQFVQLVKGEDEILGSRDDHRFSVISAALDSMRSEMINRNQVEKRFILQGKTLRVESVGRSGIYRKRIMAIIRKSRKIPHVLFYQETDIDSE